MEFFHTDVTCLLVPGPTRFKPNTRYTYRYVATSVTGVNGTTNQTTGLRLEAKCEIEGVGECQNLLRVCVLFGLNILQLHIKLGCCLHPASSSLCSNRRIGFRRLHFSLFRPKT